MGLRTDEVEEMPFKIQDPRSKIQDPRSKIQDLLVPFLPDEYPDGKPHKLGSEA